MSKSGRLLMHFYMPDGKEIGRDKFIDYYSDIYYISVCKKSEADIMKLLSKPSNLTLDDVVQILLWKTEAKEDEGLIKSRYPIRIEALKGVDKIKDHSDENAKEFLKSISEIDGLGSTYMITLLFFASSGQYPIYDKFAHMAVCAIKEGVPPHSQIKSYKEIPDKKSGYWKAYKEYCEFLKEVAGDYEYKGSSDYNRKLDRAMWVYGHMYR